MKKKKFNFGDTVQIDRTINVFEKIINYCPKICFKVSKILNTSPITYRLRDMKNYEIPGVFYIMNYK